MGRRKLEQPDHVSEAIQQLLPYDNNLPGSTSHWRLQQKCHNEHTSDMRNREVLKDGFAGFYEHVEPVDRIGDTVRRHPPHQEYGVESSWRPCFRIVKNEVKPLLRRGKRALLPNVAMSEDQIPRGKKHVPPPVDQLGDEMELFQRRRRARDSEGNPVAEKMSDMNASPAPTGRGRVDTLEKRRNGLPQVRTGDKNVSAVEYSAEYAAAMAPAMPKLNYAKVQAPIVLVDQWARRENARVHQQDIQSVRNLPAYADDD
jgi:hypothetical protein